MPPRQPSPPAPVRPPLPLLLDERRASSPSTHGGWRPNAGRKRGKETSVLHRIRPDHAKRYPSHVTLSFLRVAGNLRKQRVFNALRAIILRSPVEGFQVVHYSVQKTHLHLVVEAVSRDAFSSGMRSLGIRAALKINALFGRRKGKVVRERYHRRDLFNAKQVRTVLRYVLLNGARHHVVGPGHLDPCSSAYSFDGWREVDDPDTFERANPGEPPDPKAKTVRAWTRLLLTDWREHGLISPYEALPWQFPPSELRRAGIDM